MTKTEIETITNIVARLNEPNCGCSNGMGYEAIVAAVNAKDIEAVSRIYLNTWIIPSLRMLLPGDEHDPKLALSMSRR